MGDSAAMAGNDLVLRAQHDPWLVALSIVISIVAAYAARDLSLRVIEARGRTRARWLACAALVDGMGTWSMHYTGKLALILPVPLLFDWRGVLLSYAVAVTGSATALWALSRSKGGWGRCLAAAFLLGVVGVSGLHYTAMAAMRLPGMHHVQSFGLGVIAVVVAIGVGFLAALMLFHHDENTRLSRLRLHAGAVLRGMANPTMHYTAMAGVSFVSSAGPAADMTHIVSISSLGLLGISVVPVIVLVVALMTSLVDRLQKQRALLNELFEQAPQAVALMTGDNRVVRVNREFTRLFGYDNVEATGRQIENLIIPEDYRTQEQGYTARVARGERLDAETVRRRKDGSPLYVAITRVPVALPGGRVEIYAIYRDITKRRQAEEALRQSEFNLRELLEERQRLSRDLHDHIVQAIYAIGMRLERIQRKCAADVAADLGQMIDGLNQVIRDARQYIAGTQPQRLDADRFRAELATMVDSAGVVGLPSFQIDIDPGALASLSPLEMEHLLNIAREALSNALRHSRATQVVLTLQADERGIRLEIVDDGIGFDASRPGHGSGLQNMASRARQMGAKLDIQSAPDGTRITVEIPRDRCEDAAAPLAGSGDNGV